MADDNEVVTPENPAIAPETPAVLGTKDIVTAIVKDDDEGARAAFHQVLQTKMRDRISPPDVAASDEGGEGDDEGNTEDK